MFGDGAERPPKGSLTGNPAVRAAFFQILLVVALVALGWWAAGNVAANLRAANIATGFGFLWDPANFDITQSLISYNASMSYGRALLVGLLNTLLVSAIGIVLATLLGFVVGIARLSKNVLVAKLAQIYVELLRNVPLLLQLLFWYNAVLKPLPGPRQSLELGGGALLNNRGLFLPTIDAPAGGPAALAGLGVAALACAALVLWNRRRVEATGRSVPVLPIAIALLVALPAVSLALFGGAISLNYPELRGFNVAGGVTLLPEFVALLLGLVLYTAAFIAEIVRAGIVSVSKGQTEAAEALGLRRGLVTRLVIVPQALRLIIPPLTGQYLNLTKNSSLAVAIGYPELVQVGAGPVLQNTGQALEVISLIMLVYLIISLVTSLVMNLYNRRIALVER
ncbi:amino acid ABC transporter permease [Chelatococcus reniformis]|uniref:Amino acid ABC transporter permease n=1 Tax=Chelatococcus reniformis TaxID=1494448 RepID=A0A916UF08_9HYPH|nr:ABC transporter permease subunit [Chelatococcus reniformis]GGC71241.1 amino acid ABC transporter permease [Chelatococcus reniformis]